MIWAARLYHRAFPYSAKDAGVPGLARRQESDTMKRPMIGTRNGGPSNVSGEARDLYAAQFDAQGPAWANLAGNIRAGFENLWVTPALKAIDQALRSGPQHDDDDPDSPD